MPIRMRITGEATPDAAIEGADGAQVIEAKTQRIPSTIQFPYTDMGDAILVAEGLLKGGGVPLSRDQMAAAIGLSPNGGGFATKVATARTFGVIEAAAGKYQLSELGHEIVDPSRQANAKVAAFLNVALFRRAYDEFRGKLLPPRPVGLERAFVSFGVSERNVSAARLAFDRSARIAGMFPNASEDRLVVPFGVSNGGPPEETPQPKEGAATAAAVPVPSPAPAGATQVTGLHRSILGMLDELPAAKSKWSKKEQADWLDALAGMFQVLYKSDERGEIKVSFTPEANPF